MGGRASHFSLLRWVLLLCTFILIAVLLYEHTRSARYVTALAVEEFSSYAEKEPFEALDVALEQQLGQRPNYAVYVEDLKTGAWVGVREDTFYEARSLAKVFLLVAVLREIEDGELHLNDTIRILDEDKDPRFGNLSDSSTDAHTVHSLLYHLIRYSDNTAMKPLVRQLEADDYMEMFTVLSFDLPTITAVHITPESYGSVLADIYHARCFSEASSRYALSLLSDTVFVSQIPAGVPSDTRVAHKIAVEKKQGLYHDCGIVFAANPYVICVMSTNTTKEEADQVISQVSRLTYERLHVS